MTIIDKSGERQACDRCHRVRVRIRRGTVCEACREFDRQAHERAMVFVRWARGEYRETRGA